MRSGAFLSFPISAWRISIGGMNPESGGLIREAKQSFAETHSQAALGNDNEPAPHRHSGIFIPPAPDSGIAVLRRRNENIRNLLQQRERTPMGRGDAFPSDSPPAIVGGFRTFSSRAIASLADIQHRARAG